MTNEQWLINANELIEDLKSLTGMFTDEIGFVVGLEPVLWKVNAQPAVDAVEVVHGRWLYDSGNGKYFCSACDEYALSFKKDTMYGGDLYEVCLTDYCPNCGAKMDLEEVK